MLIAKAGGSAEASENTLDAVEAALTAPVPPWAELAVEVDVRLSADGAPLLIHDARLERTTNGRGPVREQSLTQLRRLHAGARGERIPLLEEVFGVGRDEQVIVDVHDRGAETAERVLLALRRAGPHALSRTIVASEHGSVIRALREREPQLRTAATKLEAYRKLLLTRLNVPRLAPRGHLWMVPVRHAGVEVATRRFVASARQDGDEVWVFVVDEASELFRLRSLGVTGCFTTRPIALSRALSE